MVESLSLPLDTNNVDSHPPSHGWNTLHADLMLTNCSAFLLAMFFVTIGETLGYAGRVMMVCLLLPWLLISVFEADDMVPPHP